jgi:alpha/beta superfamily hydrolase
LEGELLYPETAVPLGAAVVANPHPLLGGDMRNNVIDNLGDGLTALGWVVLRFNYRGVGRSEGPPVDVERHLAEFVQTSHVADELDLRHDVTAAAAFLRDSAGWEHPLIGIGYSFGCALLPRSDLATAAAAFVLIAPTVSRHDHGPWREIARPKLVIASEDDFATDAATLRDWFERLRAPKRLLQRRLDNHFFRGHEAWIVKVVAEFLAGLRGENAA